MLIVKKKIRELIFFINTYNDKLVATLDKNRYILRFEFLKPLRSHIEHKLSLLSKLN
jgi:hypothetical protein